MGVRGGKVRSGAGLEGLWGGMGAETQSCVTVVRLLGPCRI